MASGQADEKTILLHMQKMQQEVIKCMDNMQIEAKKIMTTREFDVEDGHNVIWYQTLRLYNEGLVPRNKVYQP
jgi:prolyl oligopeptidase PreP (S9A serine peptidase family)